MILVQLQVQVQVQVQVLLYILLKGFQLPGRLCGGPDGRGELVFRQEVLCEVQENLCACAGACELWMTGWA